MTDIDRGETEARPDLPPFDWFEGRGPEGEGIEHVFPSSKLRGMAEGGVGKQLDVWSHLVAGEIILDNPFTLAKEASELPDEKGELKERGLAAEQFVLATTGFTPRELADRRDSLQDTYRGQSEAPFSVILWPQGE